jgi:SAM-dependent methyltransferase
VAINTDTDARLAAVCPWCGASVTAEVADGFSVARCRECRTAFTWPVPSDGELDAAYGDWYRPQEGRFSGPGDRLLRWTRSRLARRIDKAAPPGRILDVGAGDGTLVGALRATGRDAIGLERSGSGPYVRSGEVSDVGGQWAAIVFWHSLEHLRRPAATLADAIALLEPRGMLIVAVPNYDSLQARLFGDRWFALDLPRHLVHFDAPSLIAGLEDLGLHVERQSYVRGGQLFFGWVNGLVGGLPGHPDLYAAIRRASARDEALSDKKRMWAFLAALCLSPLALLASAVEVALRRGGTVYVEARK